MSYIYETQWDSPNFTPASQTRSVWGVDRNILRIDCHWWDDPAKNPSYEGTIQTLLNPNRGASAHYVATGTGRRVACLVSPNDNSWATNQDNPYSISIECDPRCRDEDYDVVAELIANIRSAYGDLPLARHSDFVATRCPGDWDLVRLDALARTKNGDGDWGVVYEKVRQVPEPVVEPVVILEPIVEPLVITPEPQPVPVIDPTPVTTPIEQPKNIVITSDPNADNLTWRYKTNFEKFIQFIKYLIKSIFK